MWWWGRNVRKDQDLNEEMLGHLAIEVKQRIDAGEKPECAEQAARRQFGNLGLVEEATREIWGWAWLESLTQDFKYATRMMRKTPSFTAIAILTTGLAVGASTTVFSVVNAILLRPLPYPQSDQIAMLWRLAPIATTFGAEDYPWGRLDFSLYHKQTRVFEFLGAFEPDTLNLTGSGDPVFLEGVRASAGFFPALGIAPAIGRWFTSEDDQKGHEHTVVLGDRLWRDHFGADRSILGRSIELNGFNYTVIGVMPRGFSFPHAEEMPALLEFPPEAQLWVPLAIAPGERGPNELAVIGRMRPKATMMQAQAELDVFAHTFERVFPTAKGWSRSRAMLLEKQVLGDTKRPLMLLLSAVGLVLLIACSNVAGLVTTRSLGRSREFSLRAALGARSSRLIRQLLIENLLLAAVAGMLGMLLAAACVQFVKKLGPSSLPRLQEVDLDWMVFAFCVAVTLITGVLFALAPAFGAMRENVADSLRSGSRIVGNNASRKLRNGLLVGQIALALVLVIASGLLVRSFYSLLNADTGFKIEHVLTFEISLPTAKYPDPDHMARLYTRVLHTLQTVPGLRSIGMVHAVPMGGAPDATVIRVPGRPWRPDEQRYANYMFGSPGYFGATRTPLLRGRDFIDSDTLDSMPVTIVNRAMADALWPGEDAIGKHVGVAATKYPVRTVVGVVANVKQSSLREHPDPEMYVPFTQNEIKIWPPMRTMQVALRTASEPTQITASVRDAMRSVDPELPIAKLATLSNLVDRSLTQPRCAMLLLSAFGSLALILACVGMYGVISHSVTQRMQEIGIRMALGAERKTVFGMILKQGVRLAAAGVGLGVVGASAAMRTLSSFLYGIRASDPLTFSSVSALVVLVAVLACCIPARRATRVDPVIALREE